MILEIKDIKKKFGENEVLKGVSFHVESGKALGLLGRNGAGKTTTIRILMDVFRANSGEILLDGKKFEASKMKIGYLPEERGLYPKRTVMEQMLYLARLRGANKKEAVANSKRWLERLGVLEYENKMLETLSKGNQQKVQLASTLVSDPDIVILDEPFSGLDPVNSQVLQDVVNELIEDKKIVIFSSHQMSYVEEFCRDIVIINKGEVVLDGNLMDIKREYGRNQIVIAGNDLDGEQTRAIIEKELASLAEVTKVIKNDVVVKLKDSATKKELFKKLIDIEGLEIEHVEDYKPSLNDIFVAKVGE